MTRTLLEAIWSRHVVTEDLDGPSLIYIDLHLLHEVTSPQAFDGLRARGVPVRRPDLTVATTDHSVPTTAADLPIADQTAARQVATLERHCLEFGVPCYGRASDRQGIVHVIGPELGLTHPGSTIVCGDSHTATHGAFGALAFGIGTSEVEMVLATQCLLQRRPRTLGVRVDGRLGPGVTAKDLALAIIARLGVRGGAGHVIEYYGSAIRALSMDARMTVCNMSIEAGARAGLVAPDDTTFADLAGRPHAPAGAAWDAAVARWRALRTDDESAFDARVTLDVTALEPLVTVGTHPGVSVPVGGRVPDPADAASADEANGLARALAYLGLTPGQPIAGHPIDVVFVGSCTNGRLTDLRQAASVLRGRRVHPRVRMLVVPGSKSVKRHAEAEGLDAVFRTAGAEWREPGCSMCLAMNGDTVPRGALAVSTSNRNFEGRQGPGSRTILASPLTAAASAVAGAVADPRRVS